MATNMNSMSKNWLNARGYVAELVEHYNPRSRRSNDLFGFADVIAFKSVAPELIQVSSANNRANRLMKVVENNTALWLARNHCARVVMHFWSKKKGRWVLERVDITNMLFSIATGIQFERQEILDKYHELKDKQRGSEDNEYESD